MNPTGIAGVSLGAVTPAKKSLLFCPVCDCCSSFPGLNILEEILLDVRRGLVHAGKNRCGHKYP
jgi:hypothetical protein